jgi:hypothetical protein
VTAAGVRAAVLDGPAREGGADAGLSAVLRDAFVAVLPLVAAGTDPDRGLRAERRAALAVADAVLEACGIRPEPAGPVPQAAVRAAAELLPPRGEFDRLEAAAALAALFENAVGSSGRRNEGVVYTPPDVVRFMVREGLAARIASEFEIGHDEAREIATGRPDSLDSADRSRLAKLLGGLRVADPAVGAGVFIAAAANEICSLAAMLREGGIPVPARLGTPRAVLERCCHGFEVDPDATRMAGAVLALSCEGGNARTVPRVVTTRNTLLGGLDHANATGGWDVVLMNPPYVGEKHLRKRLGSEFQELLRARDGFSGDLLSHFLLRAIEGVKPGGALSAIVSDTAFTMGSAAPIRDALLEQTTLYSLAWCRPFAVAAQGGIVTAIRGGDDRGNRIACFDAARGQSLDRARPVTIHPSGYTKIPGRPLYRPSAATKVVTKRWREIDGLGELWGRVAGKRRPAGLAAEAAALEAGEWTLLGAAVQAGQGLATGDDRRFVGFLAGTDAGHEAARRRHRILEALRSDPARAGEWRRAKRLIAAGAAPDEALVALLDRGDAAIELPGRKPFRVVDGDQCRRSPLTADERRFGIADGPHWIPYETSDRSGPAGGGARWTRETQVVIDWSADAVGLLRRRREQGFKRPVLRHEELWFRGGVTHNRVASYLRARLMPKDVIFSSESPCYVPAVPWLSELSLLALLNSPVVEFTLKTFLATRNHVELGHVLRIPLPVLDRERRRSLEALARAAIGSSRSGDPVPAATERDLDLLTRDLYGIRRTTKLPVAR